MLLPTSLHRRHSNTMATCDYTQLSPAQPSPTQPNPAARPEHCTVSSPSLLHKPSKIQYSHYLFSLSFFSLSLSLSLLSGGPHAVEQCTGRGWQPKEGTGNWPVTFTLVVTAAGHTNTHTRTVTDTQTNSQTQWIAPHSCQSLQSLSHSRL